MQKEGRHMHKSFRVLLASLVILLLFGRVVGAQGTSQSGIVDGETYKLLSGVWNLPGMKERGAATRFSWGTSKEADGSVAIDLRSKPPSIHAPNMGRLKVLKVKKKDINVYELSVEDMGTGTNYEGTIRLQLIDRSHLIINDQAMKPFRFFDWSGPKYIFHKVAGPSDQ
jgi:hypothetical protein